MSIESLPEGGEQNHFTLLRLVAASAVIIGHSSLLALGADTPDPFYLFGDYHLGITAVIAFFAISGFFVCLSFERRRSNAEFVLARVTRILPGLLVAATVTAFVVGPLFTRLPLKDYFSDWSVWLYPLQAVSIVRIMAAQLPELFASNPFPSGVNIPLWTLYYEVACYAGLFLAGIFGLIRPRRFPWLVLLWVPVYAAARYGPWPALQPFATFSVPFVLGMAVYRYRSAGILNGWLALALLAVASGLAFVGHGVEELWSLAVGYGVLCLGFAKAPAVLAYNRVGDFSYGTYIYGFIVQQMVAALVPGISLLGMIALSLPLAISFGAASWYCVERPAIDLRKRRVRAEPAPRTQP